MRDNLPAWKTVRLVRSPGSGYDKPVHPALCAPAEAWRHATTKPSISSRKRFASPFSSRPFFFSPHDFLDRTYEFYKKAGFRRELVTSEQGLQGVLDFLSESIPEAKTAKPSQFFDDRFVRAVNAAK